MNTTSKTVRVFISSTFRDLQGERGHLVTVVFPESSPPPPRLRRASERVEQLGLEFCDVELRGEHPGISIASE